MRSFGGETLAGNEPTGDDLEDRTAIPAAKQ